MKMRRAMPTARAPKVATVRRRFRHRLRKASLTNSGTRISPFVRDDDTVPQPHQAAGVGHDHGVVGTEQKGDAPLLVELLHELQHRLARLGVGIDRKSTRLNSSHVKISYAGF